VRYAHVRPFASVNGEAMNFASDNVYGVHPKILQSLSKVNEGTAPSYAGDEWSKRAEARLCEIFETDVRAFLVTTGTAANGLALQSVAPPHGAIFCRSMNAMRRNSSPAAPR
jgi:threonine aldolase